MPYHIRRLRALTAAVGLGAAACGVGGDPSITVGTTAVDSVFTFEGVPVPPATLNGYLARQEGFTSRGGEVDCAYLPLGASGGHIYVNALCLELVRDGDSVAIGSARAGPVAFTLVKVRDSVRVVSYQVPNAGGAYATSVRRIFPDDVANKIMFSPALQESKGDTLELHLRAKAATRFGLRPRG